MTLPTNFCESFLPELNLAQLVAAANQPDQYDAVTKYMESVSND
jgi:hypothetical protein